MKNCERKWTAVYTVPLMRAPSGEDKHSVLSPDCECEMCTTVKRLAAAVRVPVDFLHPNCRCAFRQAIHDTVITGTVVVSPPVPTWFPYVGEKIRFRDKLHNSGDNEFWREGEVIAAREDGLITIKSYHLTFERNVSLCSPVARKAEPRCTGCGYYNEYQDGPYYCSKCKLEDHLRGQ